MKKAHIPYEIFNELETSMEQKNDELQRTVNSLSKSKEQNIKYLERIADIEKTIATQVEAHNLLINKREEELARSRSMQVKFENDLNELRQKLKAINVVGFLNGVWDFRKKGTEHYEFTIGAGNIRTKNLNDPTDKEHKFKIDHFFFNPQNQKIFFIRKGIRGDGTSLINDLTLTNSEKGKVLEGTEGGEPVTYKLEFKKNK